MDRVRTGIEYACRDPDLFAGSRVGLITNHTGVLPDLTASVDALRAAGVRIVALFGPERGLRGTSPAGMGEPSVVEGKTGLPSYDTFGADAGRLAAMIVLSGADTLVLDLQTSGGRCDSTVWTVYDLMLAAARTGRRFVVLDRPNPVGGMAVEGPLLDPWFAGPRGRVPVPMRYGLTIGELARWFARDLGLNLHVVAMSGWSRHMWADETGLAWVAPSDDVPTVHTATVYPGTVLFEATNVSDGRGTTRPFELIGASFVDDQWVRELRAVGLPGVAFRDAWFNPAWGPHSGTVLRGVQVHVTDRDSFRPVLTAVWMLALLRSLYPYSFSWRRPGTSGRYPIDQLWGSDSLRRRINADGDPTDLVIPVGADWAASCWLYQPGYRTGSTNDRTGSTNDRTGPTNDRAGSTSDRAASLDRATTQEQVYPQEQAPSPGEAVAPPRPVPAPRAAPAELDAVAGTVGGW